MLENSIYSVISPEGAASIIWKDAKRVKEASEVLKLTADDLSALGVVERVISEKDGFASVNTEMKSALEETIARLQACDTDELLQIAMKNSAESGGRRYDSHSHRFVGMSLQGRGRSARRDRGADVVFAARPAVLQ